MIKYILLSLMLTLLLSCNSSTNHKNQNPTISKQDILQLDTTQMIEYIPLFYDGDKIYEYKPALTQTHKQNVKKVFEFYGENYKEVNGKLYVDTLIERELIWNYTTKAEDTIWLKEHLEK